MGAMTRAWVTLACAVPALLLAACGGGGGDEETIYVSFGYTNVQTDLRQAVSMPAVIDGLGTRTPRCSLASGTLPPGVALSGTCGIAGTPTQVGTFPFTVRLTTSGVSGHVDTTAQIIVTDPTPQLAALNGNDQGQTGRWRMRVGDAWWSVNLVLQASAPAARAGDVLTYQVVSGALPAGLVLDPVAGTLSGTVTAYGSSTASVVLNLRRTGVDYPSAPVSLTVNVLEPVLGLEYYGCDTVWAVPVVCGPSMQAALTPGSTLSFASSAVPVGFTLDPATGQFSGTPPVLGGGTAPVVATWLLPDGRVVVFNLEFRFTTAGTVVGYDNVAGVTGVVNGIWPENSGLGGVTTTLAAGQSFVIPRAGISNAQAGDVYQFELVQRDPAFPVPAWLGVDVATGQLSGTPPPGAVGATHYWAVQLTTQRNGFTLVARRNWSAAVQ